MSVEPNTLAHYERTPGVHSFITVDGTHVTAMALPTWNSYLAAARTLPEGASGYAVSAELITTPYPLKEIPARLDEAKARVETVRSLSESLPEVMFLLGTPSQDESGRLHNSLAVLHHGVLAGHVDKRGPTWPGELAIFDRTRRTQAALPVGHAALVCSDLLILSGQVKLRANESTEPLVPPGTKTLIASCCWSIPHLGIQKTPDEAEAHFRRALETTVSALFARSPTLREVIVVDRSFEGSEVAPLTAQFRKDEQVAKAS